MVFPTYFVRHAIIHPLTPISSRIKERNKRIGGDDVFEDDLGAILARITDGLKSDLQGQFLASRAPYERQVNPGHAQATVNARLLSEFDERWNDFDERISLVPGKQVLSMLNAHLQDNYNISLTHSGIIAAFGKKDIPTDIVHLIDGLDQFRRVVVDED